MSSAANQNRRTTDELPCSCALVRRAARRLTQAYDAALRPIGLKLTQYSVLANVAQAGGLSITDLAERLAMDRTTLTRNLKPLLSQGLLRMNAGEDRRQRLIAVTDEGREALSKALPLWRGVQTRMTRGLGTGSWESMIRDLDQVVALTQGR